MILTSITPHLPGLEIDKIEDTADQIIIAAYTTAVSAACPVCGQVSQRVHSTYLRHPADLPSVGKRLRLSLQVQRFFCDNQNCYRKIFVERLVPFVAVHAQRTERLNAALSVQVLAMSAEAGSKTVKKLGMPVSGDTLLRLLRRLPLPIQPTPRVLGVDDWSYRKGQTYGTILVDLERHCPVDLLPDRSVESFAAWLQAHPGIEIISRDRSAIYASGASLGAPHALQVVDRWHLLKNLGDTVQAVLEHFRSWLLKGPVQDEAMTPPVTTPVPATPISKAEKQRLENIVRRRARYEEIMALYRQGLAQQLIADQVGVSVRTVQGFVNSSTFPERKRRHSGPGILEPFLLELSRRFEAGCHNASELYRQLMALGYAGSYKTVHNAVRRLQQGLPARQPPPLAVPPGTQRYLPRQAKWLFTNRPEKLKPEETQDLNNILAHAELATLYDLTQTFEKIVSEQHADAFDPWLLQAEQSQFAAFRHFAHGLQQDYPEVKAALTLIWSNGQVEGQVNRLKLLKRQMYGRAKFDLLRQRVLQRL